MKGHTLTRKLKACEGYPTITSASDVETACATQEWSSVCQTGAQCQAAWTAVGQGSTDESAVCGKQTCDAVCTYVPFAWCPESDPDPDTCPNNPTITSTSDVEALCLLPAYQEICANGEQCQSAWDAVAGGYNGADAVCGAQLCDKACEFKDFDWCSGSDPGECPDFPSISSGSDVDALCASSVYGEVCTNGAICQSALDAVSQGTADSDQICAADMCTAICQYRQLAWCSQSGGGGGGGQCASNPTINNGADVDVLCALPQYQEVCANGGACQDAWTAVAGGYTGASAVCGAQLCDKVCTYRDFDWCGTKGGGGGGDQDDCQSYPPYRDTDAKGKCGEYAVADEEIKAMVQECKADETKCKKCAGQMCKDAWASKDGRVTTDCIVIGCDKACKEHHFSWCKGLSTGAIVGIVIGCVVGVALIAGILVYFLVIRKGDAEAEP
jgi:hypothetical protein